MTNCCTALLGATVMLMFGIYWATSGLKDHLAISYIALDFYTPNPSLGYSYWILIASVTCNLTNAGLITLRAFLLERDPPPPTI
ncbi:Clarin-1, partial [Operophtera brumata]